MLSLSSCIMFYVYFNVLYFVCLFYVLNILCLFQCVTLMHYVTSLLTFTIFFKKYFPETLKYWVGVQLGQSYLMDIGASIALVSHPSSDNVTIKITYRVDVLLHQAALHPIFSYWVG